MNRTPNPLLSALFRSIPGLNTARMGAMKTPQETPGAEDLVCPKDWPRFMAWPPGDLLEQYSRAEEEQKRKIRQQLDLYNAEMQKREKASKQWLAEVLGPKTPTGEIMFASLIVPGGTPPALGQVVAKWGYSTLVTRDGGELHATKTDLQLRRGSPEAVQALVIEAKKRGWSSIEVTGSDAFKRQVAVEAAKYGLPVKTRNRMGKVVLLSTGQPEIEKHLAGQNAPEAPKQHSKPAAAPATQPVPAPPPQPAPTQAPTPSATPQPQTGAINVGPVSEPDPKVVQIKDYQDRAREGSMDPDPEPQPA